MVQSFLLTNIIRGRVKKSVVFRQKKFYFSTQSLLSSLNFSPNFKPLRSNQTRSVAFLKIDIFLSDDFIIEVESISAKPFLEDGKQYIDIGLWNGAKIHWYWDWTKGTLFPISGKPHTAICFQIHQTNRRTLGQVIWQEYENLDF